MRISLQSTGLNTKCNKEAINDDLYSSCKQLQKEMVTEPKQYLKLFSIKSIDALTIVAVAQCYQLLGTSWHLTATIVFSNYGDAQEESTIEVVSVYVVITNCMRIK